MTLPLLLALQSAPASGLPPDPRLDKPLAFEARIEPLPEIAARLGRELGVELTVAKRIGDLKASVFTPARSARLTMAALASALDAAWTPTKEGYRLDADIPALGRFRAYADQKEAIRRTALGRTLNEYGFEYSDPGLRELRDRLTPPQLDALAAGRPVALPLKAASEPPETWPENTPVWNPKPTHGFASVEEGNISLSVISAATGSIYAIHLPTLLSSEEKDALRASSFWQSLLAWRTDPASKTVPELDLPLRPLELAELPKLPWAASGSDRKTPVSTATDHLALLSLQSGLPVVAEASRETVVRPYTPFSQRTLGGALREGGLAGWWRVENGALLYRAGNYWTERGTDPPEAAARAYEKAGPSLASAAAFYATYDRERVFRTYNPTFAMRAPLGGFDSAAPVLRILGRLGAAQRDAVLAGRPLAFAEMPPEALAAAFDACAIVPFRAALSGAAMPAYAALQNALTTARWTLRAKTEGVTTGRGYLSRREGEPQMIIPSVPGVGFFIGPGSNFEYDEAAYFGSPLGPDPVPVPAPTKDPGN